MAKISAVGIAAVGFGGLLLYSAVQGKGFSSALQSIIAGQSPSTAQDANQIAGTDPSLFNQPGSSNPGSTSNLGLPNVTNPSSSSETAWITAMLAAIGAPPTQANISSVSSWIHLESVYPGNGHNTGGLFNPLNTTLSAPGATDYNSVGVKNYVSEAQGLAATAGTLLGGRYSDIVSALRSGNGLCGQSFSGLYTWSGHGYSKVC